MRTVGLVIKEKPETKAKKPDTGAEKKESDAKR